MDRRGSSSSHASLSSSLTFGSEGMATPDSPRGASTSVNVRGSLNSSLGIQGVIQGLQDEQERVQKKTFTNWMNTYLCQRKPPVKVENLFEEIKDGTVLLSLLEVLSGDKLVSNVPPYPLSNMHSLPPCYSLVLYALVRVLSCKSQRRKTKG
eukprot:GHVL01014620.1.p1 GENE.GHVL01014620.1~~GHVL01014620.1.p1  ORF type:complete len:152 (+),score=12.05 GHVL01014620.1:239-694(+)